MAAAGKAPPPRPPGHARLAMTAGAVAVGAAGLATVALVLVSLRPVPDAAGHRRVVTTLRAGVRRETNVELTWGACASGGQ